MAIDTSYFEFIKRFIRKIKYRIKIKSAKQNKKLKYQHSNNINDIDDSHLGIGS